MPATPLPSQIYCHQARHPHGERGYGPVTKDEHDNPLKMVRAGDLLAFSEGSGVKDAYLNRAAWTNLAALPPDMPIVLYWH